MSEEAPSHNWLLRPELARNDWQRFVVGLDWTKSPLGPISTWPNQLRQMVYLVMEDTLPAVVYWGMEPVIVYNEAYTHLIGQKHPSLQGQDASIGFSELWDHFAKLLDNARKTASITIQDDALLFIDRNGFLEEAYFSWRFIPLVGECGKVVGSWATVTEVTRQHVSNRRMATIQMLSKDISTSKTATDIWRHTASALEFNNADISMAMLYSVDQYNDHSASSTVLPLPKSCLLEQSLGLPDGHSSIPLMFEMKEVSTGVAAICRQAMEEIGPKIYHLDDMDSEAALILSGIENDRCMGVKPTSLVVCPIRSTRSKIMGFIIIGLNPRRPYDAEYADFLSLVANQITMPHVAALLLEEEIRRNQSARKEAVAEQVRLSDQLLEMETRFSRFSKLATVGLCLVDPSGAVLFANEAFLDMTHSDDIGGILNWDDMIVEEDIAVIHEAWNRLIQERVPVDFQARQKRAAGDRWTTALCSAIPEVDESGQLKTVSICMTDVSKLKSTEAELRLRTRELETSEQRWIELANKSPLGISTVELNGTLTFANPAYYEMTRAVPNAPDYTTWWDHILEEDKPTMEGLVQHFLEFESSEPRSFEIRTKHKWRPASNGDKDGQSIEVNQTIRGYCYVECAADGSRRQFITWLLDVSAQKAAEAILVRRMDEAIEMRRQQERFIDVQIHYLHRPFSY